jgi:hypothetical protein
MNNQALQELDYSIQVHRDAIEVGLCLERLRLNRDFKRLIRDGFLSKEAVRLVHLKASPDTQSPEKQQAILTQLDSIGCLHQYFNRVQAESDLARRLLNDDEQTREEILSEDR